MPTFREPAAFEMATIETTGGPLMVPLEVRRSPRARRIRLSLGTHNQALLVMPERGSLNQALRFLHSQGDWLERQLRAAPPPLTLAEHLTRQPRVSGLGREYVVTLNFTHGRPFFVASKESGEVEFRHRAGERAESSLAGLVQDFAAEAVPPRVQELARLHDLRIRRVTVRDQGSRWGSCSGRGTVSLNWRLALLPVELHDYVILHELAHLTQMNHSPRFWELLARYDPQAEAHDRRLAVAARTLMRLGRALGAHGK